MTGISVLKNSTFFIALLLLILCAGCKEKASKTANEQETRYKTNIRFATKEDGFKEKSSYQRLETDKTEITSTKFQMEGPSWENENVAFRNYFDGRNGMDIFGKTTKEMILDSVGIDEDYHVLQDWGMDILKVGNSLGAGGIALIVNDSIYRMGVGSKGAFKIIEETPSKSALEFTFKNWKIGERTYNVSHTITIAAGTHYYEGNINVQGLKGDELLAIGMVDHEVNRAEIKTKNQTVLYSHGKQDVGDKSLGMAIVMASQSLVKIDSAINYNGNVDHSLLMLSKENGVNYKFFAGWELQDEQFKSQEYFEKIIKEELAK